MDEFLEDFEATLRFLTERRDAAALELVHWLDSALWDVVDESYRLPGGGKDALDGYEIVLDRTCRALTVLAETNPGISYCLKKLGQKPNDKPEGSLAFALNEFVLRDEPAPVEIANVATKVAASVYSAWARFVTIEHRRNLKRLSEIGLRAWIDELGEVVGIPSPMSQSLTGLGTFRMAKRLNNAFNAQLFEVFHRFLNLEVSTDQGVVRVE